jgi:hypothetical protein
MVILYWVSDYPIGDTTFSRVTSEHIGRSGKQKEESIK